MKTLFIETFTSVFLYITFKRIDDQKRLILSKKRKMVVEEEVVAKQMM
ncbi:hypothetical protein [Bacillus sp. JCM 19034]|nr:hypothetical protein [Bacillus sp. JCM 19034]